MGRKSASHHARRELDAHDAFVAEFEDLAAGLDAFLDRGDFDAFSTALYALEDRYDEALRPVDPAAPRGERLADHARRYAKASLAKSFMLTLQGRAEDRMRHAQAQMLAVAAEPADLPQYAQRLGTAMIAEGIRQEDVGHGSKALGRKLAATIRTANAGNVPQGSTAYSDAPLRSWNDLPRDFAGFSLNDVDPGDARLALKSPVCSLPPSTDTAYFTEDGVALDPAHNRRATYDKWVPVIEEWCQRTGHTPSGQEPAIWAMLLANHLEDDGSNVDFFSRLMIESPWEQGAVVEIQVVEDDIPERVR